MDEAQRAQQVRRGRRVIMTYLWGGPPALFLGGLVLDWVGFWTLDGPMLFGLGMILVMWPIALLQARRGFAKQERQLQAAADDPQAAARRQADERSAALVLGIITLVLLPQLVIGVSRMANEPFLSRVDEALVVAAGAAALVVVAVVAAFRRRRGQEATA